MNNIPSAATVINSSELPEGYELLNYVIERKLGHGGFGITYLAREIATNRAVVIKENFPRECSQRNTMNLTVGPSSAEDKELYEWALTRFLDEAKVLIRLSHPGIVPVLTAFRALGTAYYVMPQVEGKEIHKSVPLPQAINEEWLRPVLQQLLEALDYLHGEGLFHRDIKPSNILMRADTSPLLIDFGTARSSDATHTLTRIGSPGFSPSEQFLARGKNGPWTDLYSLGATCYHLITGEVPQDSMERLAEDELLPLAGRKELQGRFSEEFLSAIDKALRISHKDRWQSAQEWMNHLSAAQRAREEAERRRKEEARQQAARKISEAPAQSSGALADVYFTLSGGMIGVIYGGIVGLMWLSLFGAILGGVVGTFIGASIGYAIWIFVANKRHILIILPAIGAVIAANIGADNGGFVIAAAAAAIGGYSGAALGTMISDIGKS